MCSKDRWKVSSCCQRQINTNSKQLTILPYLKRYYDWPFKQMSHTHRIQNHILVKHHLQAGKWNARLCDSSTPFSSRSLDSWTTDRSFGDVSVMSWRVSSYSHSGWQNFRHFLWTERLDVPAAGRGYREVDETLCSFTHHILSRTELKSSAWKRKYLYKWKTDGVIAEERKIHISLASGDCAKFIVHWSDRIANQDRCADDLKDRSNNVYVRRLWPALKCN